MRWRKQSENEKKKRPRYPSGENKEKSSRRRRRHHLLHKTFLKTKKPVRTLPRPRIFRPLLPVEEAEK